MRVKVRINRDDYLNAVRCSDPLCDEVALHAELVDEPKECQHIWGIVNDLPGERCILCGVERSKECEHDYTSYYSTIPSAAVDWSSSAVDWFCSQCGKPPNCPHPNGKSWQPESGRWKCITCWEFADEATELVENFREIVKDCTGG